MVGVPVVVMASNQCKPPLENVEAAWVSVWESVDVIPNVAIAKGMDAYKHACMQVMHMKCEWRSHTDRLVSTHCDKSRRSAWK